ncbi:MAG: hypothetical protein HND55_05520 [Pseudomonadota bacterium]|nr:MAG: hypothetical protein HND55_05520 [Pseudomonadota bacterium]
MIVELASRPNEPAPESPDLAPESQESAPEQEAPNEPALAAQAPSEPFEPADNASTPAPPDAPPPADRIRAQLLSAARALGRESEEVEVEDGLGYKKAPVLPSQPGWLHHYTGRVTASIDRWNGNDGTRNARIVTASGLVLCIRTRALTATEFYNRWASVAVPMISDCGRERPQPVDRSDPWVRAPGPASSVGDAAPTYP